MVYSSNILKHSTTSITLRSLKIKKTFMDSDYTVNDYIIHNSEYKSRQLHIYYLNQCVAQCVSGGYILKFKDAATGYFYEAADLGTVKKHFAFNV